MVLTLQDKQTVRQIVKEEVKEQLTEFRSDMTSRLDEILKVTTKTDQELTVLANRQAKHSDRLDNQDKRIEKLDKAVFSS